MLKRSFFLVLMMVAGFGLTGCKDHSVFPDIAGTWNVYISFTENTCNSDATEKQVAVVTCSESGTDTTSGQIRVYDPLDTNLTCPLWIFDFTLDREGNLTIDQTLQYDPQHCSGTPWPDTWGDVQMNMTATDVLISGSFHIDLYDAGYAWSCEQAGDIRLDFKQ